MDGAGVHPPPRFYDATARKHTPLVELDAREQPRPFVRSMRPPLAHRTDEFTHRGLSVPKPENFPTALATKPYVKEDVAVHFKKCQLAK